jgi:hypothetical protein
VTEPTTEAGRLLFAYLGNEYAVSTTEHLKKLSLAIETEARAAVLREVAALLGAVDAGFQGLAVRIPNPGQRRAIVLAADNLRLALLDAEPAASETFWLIERGQPEGLDWPQWWSGGPSGLSVGYTWGRDAFAAEHYPTKDAAEAEIARLNSRPGHPFNARAVEHGFLLDAEPAGAEVEP